jgi:hypothetical protein
VEFEASKSYIARLSQKQKKREKSMYKNLQQISYLTQKIKDFCSKIKNKARMFVLTPGKVWWFR